METLLESCEGGLKWHWYSIMYDLERVGLKDVTIDPIPVSVNCFAGSYKGKWFLMSWWKDLFLLISMKQEDALSRELIELVNAFSKVIEYRPFGRYTYKGQVTVEWDKKNPEGRFNELAAEGRERLEKIS